MTPQFPRIFLWHIVRPLRRRPWLALLNVLSVALGIAVSLCASLATLAIVVLCFLLVHYQVPQDKLTSDLLMFGAGALLAALYRGSGKKLRYSLDLAAMDAAKWGARGADDAPDDALP